MIFIFNKWNFGDVALTANGVYIGAWGGGDFLGSNEVSFVAGLKSYAGKGLAIYGQYASWEDLPDLTAINALVASTKQ